MYSQKICAKEKKTHFEFEGTELPIIWTCNCLRLKSINRKWS